jgi:hypothetical protein
MKKLLLSSIVLFLFSASIILFQISCKKEVIGQVTSPQLNKIIYIKSSTLYTANYDGSGATIIPISLNNTNLVIDDLSAISPDRKTVFFSVYNKTGGNALYKCNIDGSAVQKIVDGAGSSTVAY